MDEYGCSDSLLSRRTSPSSGQAANNALLRHPRLTACHSGAALEGPDGRQRCRRLDLMTLKR